MTNQGVFFRVLLGLFVGFLSLLVFCMPPYVAANQDFQLLGVGGVFLLFGLAFGTLLAWFAFNIVASAFPDEEAERAVE